MPQSCQQLIELQTADANMKDLKNGAWCPFYDSIHSPIHLQLHLYLCLHSFSNLNAEIILHEHCLYIFCGGHVLTILPSSQA